MSEAQADEETIPAIADLDVPLVMGSRPKELIKRYRRQQGFRGTRSGRALWKIGCPPFAIGRFEVLESLLFNSYELCISAEGDAGETASRSKRQLNKHRIRFENILKQ